MLKDLEKNVSASMNNSFTQGRIRRLHEVDSETILQHVGQVFMINFTWAGPGNHILVQH